MCKYILPISVLLQLFSLPSFAVEVSFESLKKLVEAKNEKVVGQKQKIEAAQLREGTLRRSFLPKVTASAGFETFEVGSRISDQQPYFGVEGSVNVYNGGKDQLQEQVQKLNTEINRNEAKVTLAEELGKARELYWSIVYLEQEKELLAKMIKLNEKNLEAANNRIRAGIATPSDRMEFELKRLDLAQKVKKVEAERKAASYELLFRLGFAANEPLKVIGKLQHSGEWEKDLKHSHEDHEFFVRPSVLVAEQRKVKRKKQSRAWVPKVDLYAGYYQFNQREEDPVSDRERRESVLGVKVTMNLFDRFSRRNEVSAIEAEANAASAFSSYLRKQNEAHIEKEFLELSSLHDQVHDSEEQITMAEKYFKATQSEYARGAKNSPDVLGASDRLEDITRTRNQLIRDFQIARSHVLSKIGK